MIPLPLPPTYVCSCLSSKCSLNSQIAVISPLPWGSHEPYAVSFTKCDTRWIAVMCYLDRHFEVFNVSFQIMSVYPGDTFRSTRDAVLGVIKLTFITYIQINHLTCIYDTYKSLDQFLTFIGIVWKWLSILPL